MLCSKFVQGHEQHQTWMTILGLPCIAKAHMGGTLSTAAVRAGPGAAVGAEVTPPSATAM